MFSSVLGLLVGYVQVPALGAAGAAGDGAGAAVRFALPDAEGQSAVGLGGSWQDLQSLRAQNERQQSAMQSMTLQVGGRLVAAARRLMWCVVAALLLASRMSQAATAETGGECNVAYGLRQHSGMDSHWQLSLYVKDSIVARPVAQHVLAAGCSLPHATCQSFA